MAPAWLADPHQKEAALADDGRAMREQGTAGPVLYAQSGLHLSLLVFLWPWLHSYDAVSRSMTRPASKSRVDTVTEWVVVLLVLLVLRLGLVLNLTAAASNVLTHTGIQCHAYPCISVFH